MRYTRKNLETISEKYTEREEYSRNTTHIRVGQQNFVVSGVHPRVYYVPNEIMVFKADSEGRIANVYEDGIVCIKGSYNFPQAIDELLNYLNTGQVGEWAKVPK